jgi:phosphomannomutase
MSEVQLSIGTLGTRDIVKTITTAVTPSGTTAGLTTIVAVVFDKAFQSAPVIIGVNTPDEAAETCKAYVKAVTTTGMDVVLYNTVTTVAAAYTVDVTLAGTKAG